jgi:hypothetical protein
LEGTSIAVGLARGAVLGRGVASARNAMGRHPGSAVGEGDRAVGSRQAGGAHTARRIEAHIDALAVTRARRALHRTRSCTHAPHAREFIQSLTN